MTVPWPDSSGGWQLWALAMLVWVLATYLFDNLESWSDGGSRSRPVLLLRESFARSVVIALLIFFASESSLNNVGSRLLLAGSLGASSSLMWLGRSRAGLHRLAAPWEALSVISAFVLCGVIVGAARLTSRGIWILLPPNPGKTTAAFLLISASVLVVSAGTRIVRGILDRAGTLPGRTEGTPSDPAAPGARVAMDVPEYNRGKTIGNLERLLMLIVVIVGSYEALGFLIAAKGLIRSKEFEDRDFCEYFIVGSLSSALIALSVAIPLKVIIRAFWNV